MQAIHNAVCVDVRMYAANNRERCASLAARAWQYSQSGIVLCKILSRNSGALETWDVITLSISQGGSKTTREIVKHECHNKVYAGGKLAIAIARGVKSHNMLSQ